MRRFGRHLFTLATALSLLLCMAVGVLWVRGSRGIDALRARHVRAPHPYASRSLAFKACSHSGMLTFELLRVDVGAATLGRLPAAQLERFRARNPVGLSCEVGHRAASDPEIVGGGLVVDMFTFPVRRFSARHWVDPRAAAAIGPGGRREMWTLAVPHWLPLTLLAVMPALRLIQFGKARRAARAARDGRCTVCNYDLRATPQRCPECGTAARAETVNA